MLHILLNDPEPLLFGSEIIHLDGQAVGHLQVGAYGHTLGGAVGIGFVSLDVPITASLVSAGRWEVDVAGRLVSARASLKPLLDPGLERVRC
jgi:4-methylaminobutanoate oxidase (formaldehyde-forming)